MSELKQQRWAIISERGVEAHWRSYEEAVQLRRNLDGEKVYGLCIVTDEAAEREAHQIAEATRQLDIAFRQEKKA